MRVNIPFPKAYYDKNTTPKQRRKLLAKHSKHCQLSAKRK